MKHGASLIAVSLLLLPIRAPAAPIDFALDGIRAFEDCTAAGETIADGIPLAFLCSRIDRSALDLLAADYTFVNERLAKHYGIPNIYGSHFRRITLPPDSPRGGLLGQGSILAVTAYATRTSPVVRGKWLLENILGTPPPPPPPNVPPLSELNFQTSRSLWLTCACSSPKYQYWGQEPACHGLY